jgi:DNA-binding transcriptional LysR family regulator
MKISQIQALVAVAEYGKFSEAALELDLSQPRDRNTRRRVRSPFINSTDLI